MSLPASQIERKVFSVSEITSDLKNLMEDCFPSVWIQGEISNFKNYASGHYYFTLKDENAQLSGVMFKGNNRLLKFELEDGMKVIAHGRITIYEVRGQYQMIVDRMEPDGVGSLQLAFEQLKAKLKKEGLFDHSSKKALPKLPQTIGIVTSLHGAAVHDMMSILRRRFPNINILIYPVKVQGEGSAQEISEAIGYFSKNQNVDVLIVGRGGGSLEDLWSFNEEIVARAIHACPIPVISAVGHETDFSISDFVADHRAPTPSAAAELAVPVRSELWQQLQQIKSRFNTTAQSHLKQRRKELAYFTKALPHPRKILENWLLKISDIQDRIYQQTLLQIRQLGMKTSEYRLRLASPQNQIQHSKTRLYQNSKSLEQQLKQQLIQLRHAIKEKQIKIDLLNPKNVLKRGYVMVQNKETVITRAKNLKSGDKLDLIFHDETVQTQVLDKKQRKP